ncbi:hypothetical protein KI387_009955, partial [Taxus chinensis]
DLMRNRDSLKLSMASMSIDNSDLTLEDPEVKRKNTFQCANGDFLIGKLVITATK